MDGTRKDIFTSTRKDIFTSTRKDIFTSTRKDILALNMNTLKKNKEREIEETMQDIVLEYVTKGASKKNFPQFEKAKKPAKPAELIKPSVKADTP